MRVKRLKFNWLTAVALVLVAVTVTALIGNLSGGFQKGIGDWSVREVNKNNLYQSLIFADTDGVYASGENGVSIKLKDDNVIKVSGTAEATEEKGMVYNIGSTTLRANTSYVFDSSLNDGSNGTIYMSIVNSSTGTVIASSYRGPVLISAKDITEDVGVHIELVIKNDTDVNVTLRPILCVGNSIDDVIDFYE